MIRLCTAILFLSVASAAMAQSTTAPAGNGASNSAVSSSSDNTTARPAAGANSFTEDQARSRIEAKGYTKVSGLAKDADGIWRGKGMKDDMARDVAVDYQGNVFGK